MASVMTVKRLRHLLANKQFDNAVVYLPAGDALLIGSPSNPTHFVDFFSEDVKEAAPRRALPTKAAPDPNSTPISTANKTPHTAKK